jgi:hypothetical protein
MAVRPASAINQGFKSLQPNSVDFNIFGLFPKRNSPHPHAVSTSATQLRTTPVNLATPGHTSNSNDFYYANVSGAKAGGQTIFEQVLANGFALARRRRGDGSRVECDW